MSLPPPPKSSGVSRGKVAIIAAATFVAGIGIGALASSGGESEPVSEAAGSVAPQSPTEATSSLPPAEGVTGSTGSTGSVEPTGWRR